MATPAFLRVAVASVEIADAPLDVSETTVFGSRTSLMVTANESLPPLQSRVAEVAAAVTSCDFASVSGAAD